MINFEESAAVVKFLSKLLFFVFGENVQTHMMTPAKRIKEKFRLTGCAVYINPPKCV